MNMDMQCRKNAYTISLTMQKYELRMRNDWKNANMWYILYKEFKQRISII